MEVGLWEINHLRIKNVYDGLNPCFNGSRSVSHERIKRIWKNGCVLILVLMEVGLWEEFEDSKLKRLHSLNPCFNGSRSVRTKTKQEQIYSVYKS